jgi:hypothetical protein
MKWGYTGEQDLFVARACFELLCRVHDVEPAKKLKHYFPDVKSPLINFVDILIDCIQIKDFEMLKEFKK